MINGVWLFIWILISYYGSDWLLQPYARALGFGKTSRKFFSNYRNCFNFTSAILRVVLQRQISELLPKQVQFYTGSCTEWDTSREPQWKFWFISATNSRTTSSMFTGWFFWKIFNGRAYIWNFIWIYDEFKVYVSKVASSRSNCSVCYLYI